METILHQSFTVKELLASPYPWICLSVLSYFIGGTFFRNYLVRKDVKQYVKKFGDQLSDTKGAMHVFESLDKGSIKVARLFFPISAIVYFGFIILSFVANMVSSEDAIERVATKEFNRRIKKA